MRLDSSLIKRSIEKAKRQNFEPEKLRVTMAKDERRRKFTPAQKERRILRLLDETEDHTTAINAFERLIGGNDLTSINYLAKGVNVARAVCRVHLKDSSGDTTGYGTGFMIAPGVLMTNHHVIRGENDAKWSKAEFDYELDVYSKEKPRATFDILTNPLPIANEELDFCLVAVKSTSEDGMRKLEEFGWLPLNPDPGKAAVGEYLTIIQHPGGEKKQVCVRENKLLRYDPDGNTLWYATDTVGGSSGSPAFNNSWEVVALHHSGVPRTDKDGNWLTVDGAIYDSSMDESRIDWIANEGIRTSRILAFLRSSFADNVLANLVLARPAPPNPSINEKTSDAPHSIHSEYADGELRVTVPVQISVRVGDKFPIGIDHGISGPGADRPIAPLLGQGFASILDTIERVDVDQSNYQQRTGYNPNFLGSGVLQVPLPQAKGALKHKVLQFGFNGSTASELMYWNYSIVMHKTRRLAIYSAVNVDVNLRPDGAGRDGDKWYSDTRIGKEFQTQSEFYGKQATFEADRTLNPFDRGHLTRRLDAQWGDNATVAKRNGDDTYHWTNCTPQHWQLNQGSKRWLGLEDYVIKTFAKDTGRACVISGPVFDAPLSTEGPGGQGTIPSIQGESHKDPTFAEVAIPKFYFKVVACEGSEGQLQVAAFLMSQEDLLLTVERLVGMPPLLEEKLTPAEARLYQVRLADLEKLTSLDFGPLHDSEILLEAAEQMRLPREIGKLQDIRMDKVKKQR